MPPILEVRYFSRAAAPIGSRGVQEGRRAEDAAIAFAGVLHDVDEERSVAAVPAHQVEAVESACHQHVDHAKPEVFEAAPACTQRPGE